MKKVILLVCFINYIFASQIVELSGDMSYPPYSYKQDGKAKGVYVDIIKVAFNKMQDYDIIFNMVAWKRAIAMTKSGRSIGFFPPYYSKKRTYWTKFSEPILSETTVVFAKNSILNGKYKFPEDFIGLTVCMNRGFTLMTGGIKFKKMVENKKIKLIEANSNKDCLIRIKRDMADFYINDQFINISSFPSIHKGLRVKSNLGHVGFTLKDKRYPYMKDLQNKFNNTIKQMKIDGTIDQIISRYTGDKK